MVLPMGGGMPSLSTIAKDPLSGVDLKAITAGLPGSSTQPATGAPVMGAPAPTGGAPMLGTDVVQLLQMLGMGDMAKAANGVAPAPAMAPATVAPGGAAPKMGEAEKEDEGKKAGKGKGKGKSKGKKAKDKNNLPPGIAKKKAADLPDGNPFKAALAEREADAKKAEQQEQQKRDTQNQQLGGVQALLALLKSLVDKNKPATGTPPAATPGVAPASAAAPGAAAPAAPVADGTMASVGAPDTSPVGGTNSNPMPA